MPLISPSADYDAFYTKLTFRALVDAIIPSTPYLASIFGQDHLFGAAFVGIENFVIWELDHFLDIPIESGLSNHPLSVQTAILLNEAAFRLISSGKAYTFGVTLTMDTKSVAFSILSPEDRFRALSLLEKHELNLGTLPAPYTNNAEFVALMADILNRLPMFGYYSEWTGYGTTRLKSPDERVLECLPPSWKQIGYPGPAYGYRDFRGYVLYPQLRRDRHVL